jgi:predicted DNA-binding transcriptional regulator AlpA
MTQPDFITTPQVARLTGFVSPAAFLRQRDRLERDEGFPLPMPTTRGKLIWRRDCVAAWVAESGLPRAATPQRIEGGNVVLLELARTA